MSESQSMSLAGEGKSAGPIHRFGHAGMGSVFEVLIAGQEAGYARHAADAAFEELDRLHRELSRFEPSSEVSQINNLRAGQYARVGIAVIECLKTAARVGAETGGAFDVTIGSLLPCWRTDDRKPRTPSNDELAAAKARTGMHLLDIRESEHMVGVRADGVRVDLGGIGKGYAVEQMAGVLKEWSIGTALLHGGMSSIQAMGAPPGRNAWKVSLGDPESDDAVIGAVRLRDRSLSASSCPGGVPRIIDPRTGRPAGIASGAAACTLGSWAAAASATLTDCLSTAFLVLSPAEVEAYCRAHPDVSVILIVKDSGGRKTLRYGEWTE